MYSVSGQKFTELLPLTLGATLRGWSAPVLLTRCTWLGPDLQLTSQPWAALSTVSGAVRGAEVAVRGLASRSPLSGRAGPILRVILDHRTVSGVSAEHACEP